MKTDRQKFPDLNDLAFSGRNKEYGSYVLRKKYPVALLAGFLIAIFIILLNTLIPLLVYYIHGNSVPVEMVDMYSVEYTFIPSPEDDLASLAKALAKPPPAVEEIVPQVVDSVVPEKKKIPEEEKKTEEPVTDSTSTSDAHGQNPDGTGSSDETGIYTTLDVYPRFPGGPQALLYYLRSNIRYPSASMKTGIQGEVMVLFMVEADGSVTKVSVQKGIGKECDDEAVRVFKIMPRWEPGRRNGKAVKVLVRMPVQFLIPAFKPWPKKEK